MANENESSSLAEEQIEVDLRNPIVAAVWAWFIPGAGHLYQRRYAKGILFMICILSTYFFGLALADGHSVYASWRKSDRRWQYICQFGVGAPALPALIQSQYIKRGNEPLWNGFMAPPLEIRGADQHDDLSELHLEYHSFFELGTLYTMIAGLLNILAIYDAYAGPVIIAASEDKDKPPPDEDSKRK